MTLHSFLAMRSDQWLLAGAFGLALWLILRRRSDLLKTRKAQIRFDLEAAPTGMLLLDFQGTIVIVNRQVEQLFGYDPGALLGKNIEVLVPQRFRAAHPHLRKAYFHRPQTRTMGAGRELHGLHRDGTEVPIEIRLNPLHIADGPFVICSIADISERKLAAEREAGRAAELLAANAILEQQHREVDANEKRFRLMVDSVKDYAIFMLDARGHVTGWNAGAQRIKGYQEHEIVGRHFSIFYTQDDIATGKTARALQEASAMGRFEDEGWRVRKDGSRFIANVVITALRDNDHELLGFVKVTRDITAQKQAEQELRTSEARYRLLVEDQSEMISLVQCDGTLSFVNQAYAGVLGLAADKIVGTSLYDHLPPAEHDRVRRSFLKACDSAVATSMDSWLVAANGEQRWIAWRNRAVIDQRGVISGIQSVGRDITERRAGEQKLQEITALMASVLDSASEVAIISVDPELNITVFNKGAERLLGYSRDEIVGHAKPALFHDPEEMRLRADELSAQVGYRIAESAVLIEPSTLGQPREWTYIRKDGTRVAVSLVVTAMDSPEGRNFGYVGIAQDITRQARYEQSLRLAMDHADRANKAKSEFLANMSHEIRTPLNAVIGLGYLLGQSPLNADQRQFVAKIEFAGRSLLSVVNNVLDLSKIEAGEMLLEEERFDLPELLTDIGQLLLPQVSAKGIELMAQVAPSLPRWVKGDAARLRQILTNLVNNAIKFTAEGCVTVEAWCTELEASRIRLRCEVRDTGIGIDPIVMERLFTPFTQADASTTRRFGGTGLGLSIARRFVDLMGGEIGVTSTVAVGSTFWFEIPLELAADVGAPSNDLSLPGLRILVADAAGEAQEGLGAVVRALGWTPDITASVDELQMDLAAHCTGQIIDVLILDLGLIGGVKTEVPASRMPPMIVVADAAQIPLHDAACMRPEDLLLVRPVTNSSLFNAINAAIWRQSGGRERLLQTTNLEGLLPQWLAGVRVLVVDDSDINLEVARRILEDQGAMVATCSDGSAAVKYVREQDLDVVLMDVQMPVLDGNQAAQRIREDSQFEKLPIIALTAGALLGERQQSLVAGMNDVISKPFDPLTLIRKVRHQVEQARGEPIKMVLIDRPTVTSSHGLLMTSIDSTVAQQMFGEDLPLFKTVLVQILREYADLALPTSVALLDPMARADLLARVHKLKGSAGTLGATRIMHLAGAAENTLRHNRPTADVERVLRQLAAALTLLREEAVQLLNHQPQAGIERAVDATASWSDAHVVLEELHSLLQSRDFAAVDRLAAHAPSLTILLGASAFTRLREAIDSLDFDRGASLVREIMRDAKHQGAGTSRTELARFG